MTSGDPYRQKYGLTLGQIYDRLCQKSFTITTPAANIFTADVPATHKRYVVDIRIGNNSASQLSATFTRVRLDNTTDNWLTVPVSAYDQFSLNVNADKILNPLVVLSAQQNLTSLRNESANLQGMIQWYDIPRN